MELDHLSAAVDEGVDAGVLPDDADTQGLRVRAVRNWLRLLGYVVRDNEKAAIDADFVDGVARFCAEAGLPEPRDGLSEDVVDLLRRLVCFDAGIDVERRFDGLRLDGLPLARAVRLRLYALDLIRRPDGTLDRDGLVEGLERFARVHELLGLARPEPKLVMPTVRALFDHQPVLERLRRDETLPEALAAAERRKEGRFVKDYIDAVASIELWLIGYLARPRRHMQADDDANRSLPAALDAFWDDQPEEQRPQLSRRETDSRFFRHLEAITRPEADEEEDTAAIRAKVENDAELATEVRRETRSLGARLLDGIRRVARFIGGWLRKKLGGLIALARNIAGVLARRARETFAAIRDVASAMKRSWDFLVRRPLSSSDAAHLWVSHDRDFDFVLIARPEASLSRLAEISTGVAGIARLFGSTARLVGELVGAFIAVIGRAGLGGWFGAVLALVDIRPRMLEMIELVRSIRRQLAALDSEPAV